MEIAASALAALPRASLRHPEFKDGWLLFQSEQQRKRLAPYPKEWQSLTAEELSQLCASARPELVSRTPTGEMKAFVSGAAGASVASRPGLGETRLGD